MNLLQTSNDQFTPEQFQAIHYQGNNLLLSASAGSGKTRVLVERLMTQVKEGRSLLDLLVVTFTELAAKEMKERIEKGLKEEINREPEESRRHHLQEEVLRLHQANIQTIDAFCRQVVNRYYYLIHLDPTYRLVTDETEWALFYEEVWSDLKEAILTEGTAEWEAYYSDFDQLYENFSQGRSQQVEQVDQLIYTFYQKSRSHAHPKAWLEKSLSWYPKGENYTESPLYQEQVKPLVTKIFKEEVMVPYSLYLEKFPSEMPGKDEEAWQELYEGLLGYEKEMKNLLQQMEKGTYSEVYRSLADFPKVTFPKVKLTPKSEAMTAKKDWSKQFTQMKKRLAWDKIFPFYAFEEATLGEMLEESYQLANALVRLTIAFMEAMEEKMRERKVMDFQAIELSAYDILTVNQGDNEAIRYYQERFKEVMVDEYQDVNGLQEAILEAVSRQGVAHQSNNRFMVGDVKQSIYRFRFAQPDLFMTKYQTYSSSQEEGEEMEGCKIQLAQNFRSRSEVLSFVNFIFSQLMDESLGSVAYYEEAQLQVGASWYKEDEDYQTEVLLVSQEKQEGLEEGSPKASRMELEAELVAKRIDQLVNHDHFQIYDRKVETEEHLRPVTYGDIAILGNDRQFYLAMENACAAYRIPLLQDKRQNYFQRTEIMTMLAVLKIIDNPYQDIPLAAVLRSPIVGLDEAQMARIRLANKESSYYEAVKTFLTDTPNEERPTFYQSVVQLMQQVSEWRDYAKDHSLSNLIWKIYEETGYLEMVSGMTNGLQRESNLHGLYRHAAQFESHQVKGLFAFVRYIEKIQSHQKDLETPQNKSLEENAVQLLTVHGSKGLEFPIVFYFNMAKGFNLADLTQAALLSDQVGLGVKVQDFKHGCKYTTPIRLLAEHYEKEALTSEEERKLYVALTRAEQKLILVGASDHLEEECTKWQDQTKGISRNKKLPDKVRQIQSNRNSVQDWILPTLARHPHFKQGLPYAVGSESVYDAVKTSFTLQVIAEEDLMRTGRSFQKNVVYSDLSTKREPLSLEFSKASFQYAHQSAVQTSSYQSVSELKHLLSEPEDERFLQWKYGGDREQAVFGLRYQVDQFPEPDFLEKVSQPTAAEHGTAIHLVMQSLDLKAAIDLNAVQAVVKSLEGDQLIRPQLVRTEDCQKVVDFFTTRMGQKLLQAKQVYRERAFSYQVPYQMLTGRQEDTRDKILIHGIVDGFLIDREDKIWLFDYKTDHVSRLSKEAQGKVLRQRYEVQMRIYEWALSAILEKPVDHKVLIALDSGFSFEI